MIARRLAQRPNATLFTAGVLLLFRGFAWAEDRFPRPEFATGHEIPIPGTPMPRGLSLEYLDVAILGVALALASYLALRRRSRRGIFLMVLFSIGYFGFWRRGCVCSVGAVQNAALALADNTYAIPFTVIAFLVLPLVFTLFFGRSFCAGVCPLGAAQDLVVLRPVRIPGWLAAGLSVVPVVYLAGAVLMAATGTAFIICQYDPFVGFYRFGMTFPMLVTGIAILLLGTIIARPYCRFVCPYAVILGWLSAVAKWRPTITPSECVASRLCEDACPVGAIRKPTPPRPPESRRTEVRRLLAALVALPLLVLLAAWTGGRLHLLLSSAHHDVAVAEDVSWSYSLDDPDYSLESEAFLASGTSIDELHDDVLDVRGRLALGSRIAGAFVGLVLGLRLVLLCIRRRREGYTTDPVNCISCGRCFAYCPKERERLATAKSPPVVQEPV